MFLLCFVIFYCIPTYLYAVYVKKLGFGIWDKNEFYSFFQHYFTAFLSDTIRNGSFSLKETRFSRVLHSLTIITKCCVVLWRTGCSIFHLKKCAGFPVKSHFFLRKLKESFNVFLSKIRDFFIFLTQNRNPEKTEKNLKCRGFHSDYIVVPNIYKGATLYLQ